jgi:small GTP-binding protein
MQATIGVDFLTKLCKYNCSKYKLELWDTAGQEKYRSLIKGYLRGANACVFVYDTTSTTAFSQTRARTPT